MDSLFSAEEGKASASHMPDTAANVALDEVARDLENEFAGDW